MSTDSQPRRASLSVGVVDNEDGESYVAVLTELPGGTGRFLLGPQTARTLAKSLVLWASVVEANRKDRGLEP